LNKQLKYLDIELDYHVMGNGNEKILLFHGYGRNYQDFSILVSMLKEKYTIYLVNLFFHEKSTFPIEKIEKNPIDKKTLNSLFSHFFEQENIQKFHLVGYSLGGKIALNLTEFFGDKINHLILIAPDGLTENIWYQFSCQTKLGQILFKFSISRYYWLIFMLKLAKKLNIIDKRHYDFIYTQMNSKAKMLKVYQIWMTHRKLKPNIEKIASEIGKYPIQTTLIFGKYDKIIPLKNSQKLSQLTQKKITILELESGHYMMKEKVFKVINQLLQKNEFTGNIQ
jgi:pimeloyl-ACP methyl ester carboxylesterase